MTCRQKKLEVPEDHNMIFGPIDESGSLITEEDVEFEDQEVESRLKANNKPSVATKLGGSTFQLGNYMTSTLKMMISQNVNDEEFKK